MECVKTGCKLCPIRLSPHYEIEKSKDRAEIKKALSEKGFFINF